MTKTANFTYTICLQGDHLDRNWGIYQNDNLLEGWFRSYASAEDHLNRHTTVAADGTVTVEL